MLVKAKPGLLRKTRDAWRNCLMDTIRPKMEVWNGMYYSKCLSEPITRQCYEEIGRFNIFLVTGCENGNPKGVFNECQLAN